MITAAALTADTLPAATHDGARRDGVTSAPSAGGLCNEIAHILQDIPPHAPAAPVAGGAGSHRLQASVGHERAETFAALRQLNSPATRLRIDRAREDW